MEKINGNSIERIGPTKVKFIFKCGHSDTKDFSKGPVSKRVPASSIDFLFRYWKNSGVYAECRKCKRKGVK